VTFRLADSIPRHILDGWKQEKSDWLKRLGIAYDHAAGTWVKRLQSLPVKQQVEFQRHFNRSTEACLDRGLGACYLGRRDCISVLREQFFKHDQGLYHLGDFVIMPNHVHALLVPCEGIQLEKALKQIKGSAAAACNKLLDRKGSFWQADTYDHIVRTLTQLHKIRDYIADNPLNAGITLLPDANHQAAWMDQWFHENELPE